MGRKGESPPQPPCQEFEKLLEGRQGRCPGGGRDEGVLSRHGLHPMLLTEDPMCPHPRAPPLSPQGLALPMRISLHAQCSPNSAPWELERMARQVWVCHFPIVLFPGLSGFPSVRMERPRQPSQSTKPDARHAGGAPHPVCCLPFSALFPSGLRGVTRSPHSARAPATSQARAGPNPGCGETENHLSCNETDRAPPMSSALETQR